MKEERKVFAAKTIVELAENAGLSGKLNTWADVLKFVMIASCIILLIVGFCNLSSPIGWGILISAIFQGILAILYFHLLRACAVITEAASIIVLEHKGDEDTIVEGNKELDVQFEEKIKENKIKKDGPFEVGEEVIIIKTETNAKISDIKGDDIYLSYGVLGATVKVSASEIKRQE